MEQFLRLTLPIYFIIYFGIAFTLRRVIVTRRIGKNPLVLPKDDSAYGLIGRYFKLTLFAMFIYVIAYAFFPTWYYFFLPISAIDNLTAKYTGLAILLVSLLWIIVAQGHMKNSWRVGIDMETKTELVTTGLFGISRNPIYFGMLISFFGLFLTTPNAVTGLFLVMGYVLIQIQISLEEEFLTKEHGQPYIDYKRKVRRLI
jgi:protein-S-isoprenylcysteine O-methyltransferase Ste14